MIERREILAIDDAFLKQTFSAISEWIYERTGVEFPAKLQTFDIYTNHAERSPAKASSATAGPWRPTTSRASSST